MQKLVHASQMINEILMFKKEKWKNHFKISHFRNINPLVTCYMSLDGDKSRLLFNVFVSNILYTVPKVTIDN